MATPQEISFKISHCVAELRPVINDMPKAQALEIIEDYCIRVGLNYKNIARILGYEFRKKPAQKIKAPKSDLQIQKWIPQSKFKNNRPRIKQLFKDDKERNLFYSMLHWAKKSGNASYYNEFKSLSLDEKYEWIKKNKETILNFSVKKHKHK
jgi:hypothetical protein